MIPTAAAVAAVAVLNPWELPALAEEKLRTAPIFPAIKNCGYAVVLAVDKSICGVQSIGRTVLQRHTAA